MDRVETVLNLMRLPGVGPVKLRRMLSALAEAQLPVEAALTDEGRRVLGDIGTPSAQKTQVGAIAERLRRDQVHCLVSARPGVPPVLFASGPVELLAAPSIGFCGSRSASERGLDVAADIAEQVAHRGFNVVSGGAKGVDMAAHRTALIQGGTTTVVLAEGILEYRMKEDLREVFDPARTLVVSEFFPDDRWLAGRAMQRNRTICALSRALVLIEARSTGGTFAAGEAALEIGLPLFTADYSSQHEGNDGNRILLERGAVRLRRSKTTGRANLAQLIEVAAVAGSGRGYGGASRAAEQQEMWNR